MTRGIESLKRIQHLNNILFGLNIAFSCVCAYVFSHLAIPFVRLAMNVNLFLHQKDMSRVGGNIAFVLCVIVLAGTVLVFLRILPANFLIRPLVRDVAGILAVVAAPVSWLYFTSQGNRYGADSSFAHYAPFLLTVAIVCAVLISHGRWNLHGWASFTLAAVYFGTWCYFFAEFTRNQLTLMVPLTGFVTTLVWGSLVPACLQEQSGQTGEQQTPS